VFSLCIAKELTGVGSADIKSTFFKCYKKV